MDGFRVRTAALVLAAAQIGLGAGLALGVFDSNDEPAPTADNVVSVGDGGTMEPENTPGSEPNSGGGNGPDLPPLEDDPAGLEPGPSGPTPSTSDEVAAAEAASAYVEAIDERSGRRVCAAFTPNALDGFPFPDERSRPTCESVVENSLGFEGSRGEPVWDGSEMTQDISAQIDGDSARVVATVFTEYADVREPTIEDDIIYLARSKASWLVVQPSATLYRAVGISDVPLKALAPPR